MNDIVGSDDLCRSLGKGSLGLGMKVKSVFEGLVSAW